MHRKREMGYTIFVPLDSSLDVEITQNFFTQGCKHCGKTFNSWKQASYCSPSHKASAGRKRITARHKKEVKNLKARIKYLEKNNRLITQ